MDPRATRATRVSAIHSSYAIISNVQLDLENAALSKQDKKTNEHNDSLTFSTVAKTGQKFCQLVPQVLTLPRPRPTTFRSKMASLC
jgi:hypothetical protein